MSVRRALTSEEVAELLVSRRDELVRRLPGEIRAAHDLTQDQRELIIDDSLTWLVTERVEPVGTEADAEGLLWGAAARRVKGAITGRYDTVRGQYTRAPIEAADYTPGDSENDPFDATERALEKSVLGEFIATLEATEQAVLQRKWRPELSRPAGWRTIARELRISGGEVRAAERSIAGKLETFTGAYTLGRLCNERTAQLADAASAGTLAAVPAARAHIAHCSTCRLAYAAQLRAVKSGELPRKIAALLPVPTVAGERDGRVREFVSDLIARLGGNDAANTIASAASSGVGRGSGAIAAIKIAAVFAATTGAGVGAGITTGIIGDQREPRREAPAPEVTSGRAAPLRSAAQVAAEQRAIERRAAEAAAAARRRARKQRTQRRAVQAARERRETAQERAVPTNPAPAGAAPNGGSEFSPDGATLPQPGPAPASGAAGANEFGP